jgi:hypothetical protein
VSRRNVQLVILCEDTQHEAFVRRFLKKKGWPIRRLRVEKGSSGEGSAEQFVRERFPMEIEAYRQKRHQVKQALVVMVDGDNHGVAARLAQLDVACRSQQIDPRRPEDRVAVFVPTWRIETWLAYLDGQEVDETKRDYPRLARARNCQKHVNALAEMCDAGQLRAPAPPSLEAACEELASRLEGGTS